MPSSSLPSTKVTPPSSLAPDCVDNGNDPSLRVGWEENSRREPVEKLFEAAFAGQPAAIATTLASGDVGVNDRNAAGETA